jgi:choline dehydrogenase
MLSGIGDADEISHHGIKPVLELKGVGKNLSEHPIVGMQFETNTTDTFVQQLRFDRLLVQGFRYAMTRGGPFGNQVITANAFVRTRPELETPNMQLFFAPVSFTTKVWMPGIHPPEKVGIGGSVCLLRPESRGHVTLRSANPNDPPKVTLNFMKEQVDRDATRDGLRMLRKVYNTKPLSEMIASKVMPGPDVNTDDELDAYIRKMAEVCHHPVGTCSMGINGQSVVDPELRVHGLEGLRVVDASVMPLVPSGNTNAPTIMIAEKASDMILGKAPLPAAEL